MKRNQRYIEHIPREIKPGRVLVHNHVRAVTLDQQPSVNGFKAWTQVPTDLLDECKCGWSGHKHYVTNPERYTASVNK